VPVYNVLTTTSGYRQPGYQVSVVPGAAWDAGFATYYISIPIRAHQNVEPDFTGSPKAADFAKASVQVGVQFNLGGKNKANTIK